MDKENTSVYRLTQAVLNKEYDIVSSLLADNHNLALAKLDDIDTSGSYPVGQTIMHLIGSSGDVQMAKIVMGHIHSQQATSQDIDSLMADGDGNTPMHWAAMNGKLDMVKYLHEEVGCSLAPKNVVKTTPLSDAAGYGHTDVVNYIVGKTSVDALLEKNIYELDAYTRASYLARPETLQAIVCHIKQSPNGESKLLERAGEGFNARDMAESVKGNLSKEPWFKEVEGSFNAVCAVLEAAGVKTSEKWNSIPNDEKPNVKTFDHAGRWKQFQAERGIT